MIRTIALLLAVGCGHAMACGPGEIERTFTDTPLVQSCTLAMSMPIMKCNPPVDGKQNCWMEAGPNPNVCTPEAKTYVICIPVGQVDKGGKP